MGLDMTSSKVLKGGLSILIVLHHLQYGIEVPYFHVFKHLGAPAVSVFFFLSGYGLMSSYIQKGVAYLDGFWKKRIWSICSPFIMVTLFFLLLNYFDKGSFGANLLHDLVFKGITPLPYSWFAFTIILFYVAFYFVFCKKRVNTDWKITFLIVLTFFYILLTKNFLHYQREWWVSVLGFPTGLVFKYHQGAITIWFKGVFRKISGIFLLSVVCGCLMMTRTEWLYIFVYSLIPVITVLVISRLGIPKPRFLMFLGDISYEIYLLHGVWIVFLRGRHIYITSDYLYVFLVVLLTIVTSKVANARILPLR